MTVDSLNIANGNASTLIAKYQGKNLLNSSQQKYFSESNQKIVSEKIDTQKLPSAKSFVEISNSSTPLNKPVESSQNTIKSFLNSDSVNKNALIPNTDVVQNVNSNMGEEVVLSEQYSSTQIQQSGWFITVVPDKRLNGNFLEIIEKKEDRKENIKNFYHSIVKLNKGKLINLLC